MARLLASAWALAHREEESTISITLTLVDLAGCVALLLWGVRMVQTGVQRAFGPQLRSFLSHALRNRLKAFLTGLCVTAALQSSTATGLIVAGFASDGLVALTPALAVMLGANVGTTLIVQLLSFNVVAVAPVLILLGFLMFRRAKFGPRGFGRALIGLGLLLMALHQLLLLLEPLTADPMAHDLLTRMSTHIVFTVVIGAILTWAAHSSIAVVLLAMSLAANDVLPLPAALALTLGANVGTAINPVLEGAVGENPTGKRLALGNLLNRLLGVAAVLLLFPYASPLIGSIEHAPGRAVANFHTAFNLALALLFLPALTVYARLLERWIPADAAQDVPESPIYLDPGMRDAPAVALGAAAREALRLADVLERMLSGLRGALISGDRRQIEETKRLDDVLDGLNTAIKAYVMSIAPDRLTEVDTQSLARILAFSINLEQAGDLVDRNLLGIVTRRLKRGHSFSSEGEADLVGQVDRLIATTRSAAALFLSGDERAAHALAHEKAAFRQIEEQALAAHFRRLRSGDVETIETSSLHLDALRDLKRINAHLIEAAAYPILRQRGELLPSRVRRLSGGRAADLNAAP